MSESEKYWRAKAKQFAAEHNFAWWLQIFLVGNFCLCSVWALALIVQRRYGFEIPFLLPGLAVAWVVVAFIG